MFEIVPTKLPHYILPAYPAVAFLGALWAVRARDETEPWWQTVLRIVAGAQAEQGDEMDMSKAIEEYLNRLSSKM